MPQKSLQVRIEPRNEQTLVAIARADNRSAASTANRLIESSPDFRRHQAMREVPEKKR